MKYGITVAILLSTISTIYAGDNKQECINTLENNLAILFNQVQDLSEHKGKSLNCAALTPEYLASLQWQKEHYIQKAHKLALTERESTNINILLFSIATCLDAFERALAKKPTHTCYSANASMPN